VLSATVDPELADDAVVATAAGPSADGALGRWAGLAGIFSTWPAVMSLA
jgi:hypothetical protein